MGNNLFNFYQETTTNLYEDVWFRAHWAQPQIVLSTLILNRQAWFSQNSTADVFTIRNGGSGTLSYSVTSSVPWLSVNPATGTSGGEANTITVTYNTSAMPVGTYAATITIADPAALNITQTVAVTMTIQTVAADFDRDGDVDQADFGHLQECLGSVPLLVWTCQDTRLDADSDVDDADVTRFINCFTGPNVPIRSDCAN